MELEFKKFQQTDYLEYAAWFVDPELNHRLGPMDQAWLAAVLSAPETEGITWAVVRNGELVAVVETAFDTTGQLAAVIAAIAVMPTRRQQGIGRAVLQTLMMMHQARGIREHVAYVAQDNESARWLLERVGFVPASSAPDEHGYLEFRSSQAYGRARGTES